jgi:hypothetical protein
MPPQRCSVNPQEPLLRICVPDPSYETHKRSLLASLGGSQNYCPERQGPFWSAATMFDTHILLFLVAVTHIMYTTVTMVVCLWKVSVLRQSCDACCRSSCDPPFTETCQHLQYMHCTAQPDKQSSTAADHYKSKELYTAEAAGTMATPDAASDACR